MKNRKVLILAGGLGTRLRPLTFAIPKPLIPVRGRPIIDYIISRLLEFGLNEICVSLNYQADIIKLYLSDRFSKKAKISFFEESKPLGTAGPLSLLKNNHVTLSDNESILVMNGDILTDLDFKNFLLEHDESSADITVAMINFSHTLAYGVLDLDGNDNIKKVAEKPTVQYKASAGIYLVRKKAIALVPSKHFTMPELIKASQRKKWIVKGYMIKEHWLAIEQIKQLEEASDPKKGDWISKL